MSYFDMRPDREDPHPVLVAAFAVLLLLFWAYLSYRSNVPIVIPILPRS